MNTNHTIRIKLIESGEEHTVVLLPGRSIQVSVGGDGKLRIGHLSVDAYARQTQQMKLKDDEPKKQQDENVRLESIIDSLMREKETRKPFDECIVKMATTEYFRIMMERQSQQIAQTRTELDIHFAPQCRMPLIKSALKDYITSRGGDWMQNDWVVVHKVFGDLRWWKGKDKEFVAWVNENGYALTENNFKKTKSEIKKLLAQWYTMTGTDHFVQTARDLYDLFAGGPLLPKAATYEDGYIHHAELTARIYRDTADYKNVRRTYTATYGTMNCKIYGIVMGQKRNPISILLSFGRHKDIGTFDAIGITKPGRLRRRSTDDLHPMHRF